MRRRNPMVKERTRRLTNIEKAAITLGIAIRNQLGHVVITDDTLTSPQLDNAIKNHRMHCEKIEKNRQEKAAKRRALSLERKEYRKLVRLEQQKKYIASKAA